MYLVLLVQSPKELVKGPKDLKNERTSGDHPNYRIVEISQDTEKSSRDLETCCLSNSREKPSANAGVENSKNENNNNHYYLFRF